MLADVIFVAGVVLAVGLLASWEFLLLADLAANGILVLTLAGDQVSAVTGFPGSGLLSLFGLPPALPA